MEPRCLLALRWSCLALFNSLTGKSKIVKPRFCSYVTKKPVLLNHFPSGYKKGEKNQGWLLVSNPVFQEPETELHGFLRKAWAQTVRCSFSSWDPPEDKIGSCLFIILLHLLEDSLVAQMVKRLPAMQETRIWSPGREDPPVKEMATHSSILALKIPQMDDPGGLQSMGSQRVGHNWATSLSLFTSPFGLNNKSHHA